MERLTNKREADAQREEYERRLANGYPRNIPEERFLRLAAYEDSGCEPEECLPKDKADEIALKLMRLADLESLCNYTRLRELAEADKDGRVVVLPTKPGAHVFVTGKRKIVECIVDSIYIDQRGAEAIMNFECDSDCGGCPFYSPLPDSEGEFRCAGELEEAEIVLERFWKIAFTTREEAEKAMKGETEK